MHSQKSMDSPNFEAVPTRPGPRPQTTNSAPHGQLDQIAPVGLQDRLRDHALSLPRVRRGPSSISVPGAIGFFLDEPHHTPLVQDLFAGEWGHIHPHYDGSLHLTLPTPETERLIELGWAEYHYVVSQGMAPPIIVMLYGPRDEDELLIAQQIVEDAYIAAGGAHRASDGRALSFSKVGATVRADTTEGPAMEI